MSEGLEGGRNVKLGEEEGKLELFCYFGSEDLVKEIWFVNFFCVTLKCIISTQVEGIKNYISTQV